MPYISPRKETSMQQAQVKGASLSLYRREADLNKICTHNPDAFVERHSIVTRRGGASAFPIIVQVKHGTKFILTSINSQD